LDTRPACCFCDVVTGSMLTAAAVSVKKRRSDILFIVCTQQLGISGDTWAVSFMRRCRFPTNRVGRTFGLSHRNGGFKNMLVAAGLGCLGMGNAGLIRLRIRSSAGESSVSECILYDGGQLPDGHGIVGICGIAIPSVPSGFRSCRCLN
ncbi:hypothetical protein T10_2415, partial [Trichinella papuae]